MRDQAGRIYYSKIANRSLITLMITSFRNPLVKRVKRLRKKKARQKERAYFVEGLRPVLAAAEHDAAIDTILYCPDLLTSEIAWQMLTEQQKAGVRCVEISQEVFQSISAREHAVGLGAIVKFTERDLDDVKVTQDSLFVALVEVSEPGNLGTILRTCDAVDATGLFLVGQTVDPYHPTAVKASMGAIFSIPTVYFTDVDALMLWSKSQKVQAIATSAHATKSYRQFSYKLPLLLLFGSEGEGLDDKVLKDCDMAISIPMQGSSTSLNLAVAAGIILYEVVHDRKQIQKGEIL